MEFNTRIVILLSLSLFMQQVNCITLSTPMQVGPAHGGTVRCIKPDRFREGVFFVGSHHTVSEFHLTTERYSLIAGSTSGYAEGEGSEARFSFIYDIVQLSQHSLVVSDNVNDCLRQINSNRTSPFAGQCLQGGSLDGSFTHSKFNNPHGLLLHGNYLYVLEYSPFNLRLLDLVTNMTSTLIDANIDNGNAISGGPQYMNCIQPDCEDIYITFDHGVMAYNRARNTTRLIVGGTTSGHSIGTFQQTTFFHPMNLLFLTREFVILADHDNRKLMYLNLAQEYSGVSFPMSYPWSILCYNNTLYIGVYVNGIYKSEIGDIPEDFICYQPTTTTTIPPTTPPTTLTTTPTMPTDRPTITPTNQTTVIAASIAGGLVFLILLVIIIAIVICRFRTSGRYATAITLGGLQAVYQVPEPVADDGHAYKKM